MALIRKKSTPAAALPRLRMEIKAVAEDGTFEGLLSPYGNVDKGGDVVVPGAYTKTLQEHGNTVPLLWQHRSDTPIGDLTLEDRADGLWCKGKLLMALPEAQKAYLLIKARIVKGLSIGFETIKDLLENGVRMLKEIRLYEGSIVTFPMNESAVITAVKSMEIKGSFNEELAEVQLYDSAYQFQCALRAALCSIQWSHELSRDEKLSATKETIQQFMDAYMAFLPAYLDLAEPPDAKAAGAMETKEGRKISADTAKSLKMCHKSISDAAEILLALIGGAGNEPTPDDDAAGEKSEPAIETKSHSAALSEAIEQLKGVMTWN